MNEQKGRSEVCLSNLIADVGQTADPGQKNVCFETADVKMIEV